MINNRNVLPTYRNSDIKVYVKRLKNVISHLVVVECAILEQKVSFSKLVLDIVFNTCDA